MIVEKINAFVYPKLVLIVIVFLLQGCQLFEEPVVVEPTINTTSLCEDDSTVALFLDLCVADEWHKALIGYSNLPWSTRKEAINNLGTEPHDTLLKVFLAQGTDTPYVHRLRSQTWINEVQTVSNRHMADLLDVLFYQQHQQIMELESSITIMQQANQKQAGIIADNEAKLLAKQQEMMKKQQQMDEQKLQVEQLLNVEASIVNQGK